MVLITSSQFESGSVYFLIVQRVKKYTKPPISSIGKKNSQGLFVTIYRCCNLPVSPRNKKTPAKRTNKRNKRLTDFAIMPLLFIGAKLIKTRINASDEYDHIIRNLFYLKRGKQDI